MEDLGLFIPFNLFFQLNAMGPVYGGDLQCNSYMIYQLDDDA